MAGEFSSRGGARREMKTVIAARPAGNPVELPLISRPSAAAGRPWSDWQEAGRSAPPGGGNTGCALRRRVRPRGP